METLLGGLPKNPSSALPVTGDSMVMLFANIIAHKRMILGRSRHESEPNVVRPAMTPPSASLVLPSHVSMMKSF